MERPTAMTDNQIFPWASGVTYNAANQPLGGTFELSYGVSETRAYNNLLQLTHVRQATSSGALMDMTYTYSGTNNNGQITQSVDAMTGETIVYQYDALKRLASATAQNWGETYGYDGFGNLTQMSPSGTAGAPTLSVTVDPTTNRITPGLQVSYDNNGNMTQGGYLAYDVANRMKSAIVEGGTIYYGYDSANRRIYYRSTSNAETIYLYGADGKKLGTYTVSSVTNTAIQFTQQSTNVYFAGRLLGASVDRLGSVRYGGASGVGYQAQYPYGVEYTPTANGREKYATYTRDSLTGLDYAVNRYYSSQWGRFLSPDPYGGSVAPGDPQSWNRYGYAANDPVNHADPSGLITCLVFADADWWPFPDWDEGAFDWGWMYSGIYFCPGFVPGFGGLGGGGGAGGVNSQFPDCNPSGNPKEEADLSFVRANYKWAALLGALYGIPTDWILGWSASESGYGTSPIAQKNGNFFNESLPSGSATGGWTNAVPCGAGTSAGWACFPDFAASAVGALNSKYASMLSSAYASNPSVNPATLFQQVADYGYDPKGSPTNPGYGNRVQQTIQGVDTRVDCLSLWGYLPNQYY